jgi:hypothetical protein
MKFLPTTLFKVVTPTHDFDHDFQVVGGTDYVCHLLDSNNERTIISPIVIEMRLRQGKIRVLRYPPHPTHVLSTIAIGEDDATEQCTRCLRNVTESSVQELCPAQETK